MNARTWICIASLLLMLGIMIGAFGAHALKGALDEYGQGIYEKAAFYQFVNALGLCFVSLAAHQGLLSAKALSRVGILLVAGIVLFSGSLYTLAITGERWLGAITPFGGTSFILGWALVAWETRPRRD